MGKKGGGGGELEGERIQRGRVREGERKGDRR